MSRMKPKLPAECVPEHEPAGDYSVVTSTTSSGQGTRHRARKASGRDLVETMKRMPTDDDCFGKGSVRVDGRKIHPAYLFEVKKPQESKQVGDKDKLDLDPPGQRAFRPLAEAAAHSSGPDERIGSSAWP